MNRELLKYCLQKIEEKLGWASNELWQNQDFELLSNRIFDETNIKLSITTLKRVWGKVSYSSEPSISTLNALANFIGYENWSELKNNKPVSHTPKASTGKAIPSRYFLVAFLLIIVIVFFGQSISSLKSDKPDLSQVKFGANPVTLGLPNSVVFKYEFGANRIEKASIQQSWNEKLTFSINPNGKEATGIYYYPGYFKARLIGNGQILKEQDLHIRTDGWMGTIAQDGIPRYLYYDELKTSNTLRLSDELINELHDQEIPEAKILTYNFFDDLSPVKGYDFIFEVRFRNTYKKSNGICQRVLLLVHGKEAIYLSPFSIPGCTSEIDLITAGKTYSGKENDLSVFGIDASEWQKFKLVVINQEANYYLNDKLILNKKTESSIGDIVGFKLRFEGAGEVDYVKLSNQSGIVFDENFDK